MQIWSDDFKYGFQEMALSTNNLSSFLAKLAFFCLSLLFATSAYSIEKENLDVNLNSIYFSLRPHKGNNVQGELVFQVPVPLTKKADDTGLGPIGSLAYFDTKLLVNIQEERASVRGLGRVYYVVTAYGTKQTFVPYVTFYREMLIEYNNVVGVASRRMQSKSKAWLPPGFLYAYRLNDLVVLHADGELYSYSNTGNNTARIGASYALAEKWLLSVSYESQSWNMKDDVNSNIFMNGKSNSVYLKLNNSNPLRSNFAFTLGYAADRNVAGAALQQNSMNHTNGLFGAVEISLGTLAW